MPELKTYKIFISHSWDYPEDYEQLIKIFDEAKYFKYFDYSVTRDEPLTIRNKQTYTELYNKLKDKIKYVQIVIVLGRMYAAYSNVIPLEVQIANELGKHVIVAVPVGYEKIPKIAAGADIVPIRKDSLISALRKYAV